MTPLPTAALGPPSRIDLAPAGPLLDVRIWDPRSSTNGSMKELYTRMYYRVVYWEHSDSRVQHHTPLWSPCQWCQCIYPLSPTHIDVCIQCIPLLRQVDRYITELSSSRSRSFHKICCALNCLYLLCCVDPVLGIVIFICY